MTREKIGADPHLLTLLILRVAQCRFGVAAANVIEILPALTLLPLPHAAAPVEGLARIRGAVVVVLDARRRFGMPARPMAPKDHLVLCRLGERRLVLHVDRVLGLRDCRVEPLDKIDLPKAASAIGVATDPDGPFLIHDLQALFANDAIEAALAAGAPP
jgi:purine-binding chemotaxis protein CheW